MGTPKKIELSIIALSHTVTNTNNYAVMLGEKGSSRRLPIVIGGFEAQSIAVAIEDMGPSRPLTHDLFINSLHAFAIRIKEIVISDLIEGIFYAHLLCDNGIELIEIDSRTSDALALAVRENCPIYTYDFILDAAGVTLEANDEEVDSKTNDSATNEEIEPFEGMNLEDLKELLNEAINAEDYERAAQIRDEIKKRSSK